MRSIGGVKISSNYGYVTTSSLMSEGAAIGTVNAGTQLFVVEFVPSEPNADVRNICEAETVCR
jgi:hypothetical protein